MKCSNELKQLLIDEKRWTPNAFNYSGVQAEGFKLKIPLWSEKVVRTYDMSKKRKDERASHPQGTKAKIFGNVECDELILLEGEWDYFAAYEHGVYNVITGTNGAKTFTKAMAARLYGKHVSIVYDLDDAGEKGALAAARLLHEFECKVKIVKLPEALGPGGDVRDYFTKFSNTKEDFLKLVEDSSYFSLNEQQKLPTVYRLSDVIAKPVSWVWEPRIPRGAPTIVVGQAGVGKSFFTSFLASKVSHGGFLQDDFSSFEQGPVVIFNMEDSLENTLKPRLADAGANQEIIHIINEKIGFDSEGEDFIRKVISEHKPALVVFDPITSFLGGDINMNAANEVRNSMEVPILLARDFNTAVVCVMHTNKNEASKDLLNRTMGSVDFIGAVRSVLMVLESPQDKEIKLLGHIKSNLSSKASTLSYRIFEGKSVQIAGSDPRSLQELMDAYVDGVKAKRAKDEALDFLKTALADGPMKCPS